MEFNAEWRVEMDAYTHDDPHARLALNKKHLYLFANFALQHAT
jgi:hypothetical protein